MLSSLLDRVIHVNVYGKITYDLNLKIWKGLRTARFFRPRLIAVTVDSEGGSLIEAKNIMNSIQFYSAKTLSPIYTFAGSEVLNSANIILNCGNKVFANKYSRIGDFGYSMTQYNLQYLLKNQLVDVKLLPKGNKKDWLNFAIDVRETDVAQGLNILYEKEYNLRQEIIRQSQDRFEKVKLTQDQLNIILEGPPLSGEQAKQYGLVDNLQSLDELLYERYDGVKIHEIALPKTQSIKDEFLERIFS